MTSILKKTHKKKQPTKTEDDSEVYKTWFNEALCPDTIETGLHYDKIMDLINIFETDEQMA